LIAYFDTSALVPLLVVEPASAAARQHWDGADVVASSRLVYPEARAALGRAHRLGVLTPDKLRSAVAELEERLNRLHIVEVDEGLAVYAGHLAERHGLRGYDAVHLAAAHSIAEPDVVLVAGDNALLRAAQATGLSTAAVG
jgi:predicted nucleic acid-binding protein